MSLLLTPVALICPIFNSSSPIETRQEQPAAQEQAVCRIYQQPDGVTDVSIGTSSLALYPIHYIDGEEPYLIFASTLLPYAQPSQLQLWTGDLHSGRVSAVVQRLQLQDHELQLVHMPLLPDYDAERDALCVSVGANADTAAAVQIQLTQQQS